MDFSISRRQFLDGGAAALGGLLLGCNRSDASAPAWQGPTRHRRNLLLITIDTLRADHVGCCGYPRSTTPCIDRLAAAGTLFDQVNSQYCLTWPSLASIMSSAPLMRHGVRDNETLLPESIPTLGTALDLAGYESGAFLGFAEKQRWLGFGEITGGREMSDAVLSDRLLAWLDKFHASGSDAPFFAWIHFYGPHLPWRPGPDYSALYTPEPELGLGSIDYQYQKTFTQEAIRADELQSITALYDAEIRTTDDCIAKILAHLESLELIEDTLVAVSADHGTELYDHHNYALHWGSPYNGVYRVPLVLWGPDTVPAGQRVSRPVRSIDIAPTLLELLGQKECAGFSGASLLSALQHPDAARPPAISEFSKGQVLLVREDEFRYLFNPEGLQNQVIPSGVVKGFREKGLEGRAFRMPLLPEELYDVSTDPYEKNNLSHLNPEVANVLAQRARAWAEENQQDDSMPSAEQIQDADHKDALEALGYL